MRFQTTRTRALRRAPPAGLRKWRLADCLATPSGTQGLVRAPGSGTIPSPLAQDFRRQKLQQDCGQISQDQARHIATLAAAAGIAGRAQSLHSSGLHLLQGNPCSTGASAHANAGTGQQHRFTPKFRRRSVAFFHGAPSGSTVGALRFFRASPAQPAPEGLNAQRAAVVAE